MTYLTQKIYEESKPDAYQPLFAMVGGSAERIAAAKQLESQGYVIDKAIDVWGWDAGLVMAYRQQLGFKTVPSSVQAMPGTIKVSVDAADYPPAHPAVVPTPVTSPVGPQSGTPGVYGVTQAAFDGHGNPLFPEGFMLVAQDGAQVTFHAYLAAPFGMPAWEWETSAAKAKRLAEEATEIDNSGRKTGGAVQA